jgi:hypothetical protein
MQVDAVLTGGHGAPNKVVITNQQGPRGGLRFGRRAYEHGAKNVEWIWASGFDGRKDWPDPCRARVG